LCGQHPNTLTLLWSAPPSNLFSLTWNADRAPLKAIVGRFAKVYRGKIGGKSIHINGAMLPKTEYVSEELEVGHNYLALLRPSEESMKVIKSGEHVPVWDA